MLEYFPWDYRRQSTLWFYWICPRSKINFFFVSILPNSVGRLVKICEEDELKFFSDLSSTDQRDQEGKKSSALGKVKKMVSKFLFLTLFCCFACHPSLMAMSIDQKDSNRSGKSKKKKVF